MIPKIIHYCWLSGREFSPDAKNNIVSWKNELPDYEFILWDAKRSEVIQCLWIEEAIKNKKYAFASDFIRLYAVYTYGGIYLDCDVQVLKDFDNLLHLSYFIGSEQNRYIEAAVFGAQKQSPWISNIMEHYKDRSFVNENGALDMAVLPSIMKSRIELEREIKIMTAHEVTDIFNLQKNENLFYLFPSHYFSPKNIETGKIITTDKTYTIHHFSSQWLPFTSKIRRKIIQNIGRNITEKIIYHLRLRQLRNFLISRI